ncbi:MAG TPA: hypothetical protein DCS07_02950 [Bdellovibrionales bacterium]|nr:MAG: hypothetical protein A2Z97_11160 [Bdellovibrionales bacterium GWB1_52_6]OFZ02539.1 MAG: hypothetical protein A2X97_07720 [Bdellovibrionales bacterium GWA1_52_35]OFZ35687.1 MAG: hypothetical protein A2070_15370 [Bdellovibrionales bacterium GWC1_52_8]HAR41581.1 hypothetical protein [Bdellovibrionales bacterium]HCM41387.1 hypothetical protein [Bdellovibrionales bacterium]
MIKINLATRKQPAGVDAKASSGAKLNLDFGSIAELLRDPVIKKLVLVLIVGSLAWGYLDFKKEELLTNQQTVIDSLHKKREELEREAAKIKNYEKDKLEVEAAQALIRTKLEVMTKLTLERAGASKILKTLSSALPPETWLTDFRVKDSEIVLKGNAVDFTQISDLIKALQENATFMEVTLKSSQTVKDESGAQVAAFEMGAKQRQ